MTQSVSIKSIFCALILVTATFNQALAAPFTADFAINPVGGSPVTSFTDTWSSTSFTVTFESTGDGGDMTYVATGGDGDSAAIHALSVTDTGPTEQVTIKRTDAADFLFTSIWVNPGAADITVAGYNNGGLIGSSQVASASSSVTLNFSGIIIDEIRITS
ncbi:MAG: hypothetical protein ABUK13_10565, partial [Gammaproteobacteria bacterium]